MTKVYEFILLFVFILVVLIGSFILGIIRGRNDNQPSEDHAQTRYQLGEEMRKEIKKDHNHQIFT